MPFNFCPRSQGEFKEKWRSELVSLTIYGNLLEKHIFRV